MFSVIKNRILKGIVTKPIEPGLAKAIEGSGAELRALIQQKFRRSLNIREVDTGSCGACESELIACSNPIYDIQRFGIDFVASPRHADALLVTGPVTRSASAWRGEATKSIPKR